MNIFAFLTLWLLIFIGIVIFILPSALWFFSLIVNMFKKEKKITKATADFKLTDLKEVKEEIK